jgi:hypothetical protein
MEPQTDTGAVEGAQTATAAAAAETAAAAGAAAPAQQEPAKELAVHISGQLFWQLCSYTGAKPLRAVAQLRPILMNIQREQNVVNPAALPETVWMPQSLVDGVFNFLLDQPCDEVLVLAQKYEQEVTIFMAKWREGVEKAAAAAAITAQTTGGDKQQPEGGAAANDAPIGDGPKGDAPAGEAAVAAAPAAEVAPSPAAEVPQAPAEAPVAPAA